jgi:membrane protein DedA with SNARE-associated domain
MSLESFIMTYGYPALFLGTFLEGEVVALVAGYLTHRGYFEFSWVVLIVSVGTIIGDNLYFYLGRTKGKSFLEKRPNWHRRVKKINRLLKRYQMLLALSYRFLYGLRIVTPFALGMSDLSAKQFAVLSIVSVFVWAILVISGGYAFGHFLNAFIADIRKYEIWFLISLVVAGCLVWIYRHITQNFR